MLTFAEIDKPRIDIELYGSDTHIPPIDKVHVMDEDSFEQFTLEWLYGCKKSQYSSIKELAELVIKVEILLLIMLTDLWTTINVNTIILHLLHPTTIWN